MTSNAGAPDRPGGCIGGKYQLLALIAEGGMGRVYRARNELLGREVAVKVLLAHHAEKPDLVARFVREARTANLVRHPNVVDVLDVGIEPGGPPYMVQELLQGQDLCEHLKAQGGKLGEARALSLMEPVIDAVAYAHARGVVHRDLKPENIFLVRDGDRLVPKVLDFGISRCVTPERAEGDSMIGMMCGTPAYMPPEQVRAEAVDARADVWALGVILFELIAGALPFAANHDDAMLALICFGEPSPLESIAPTASSDVCRIVARCLRRFPGHRYASAAELLADLRQAMRARGIPLVTQAGAPGVPARPEPEPAHPASGPAGGEPQPSFPELEWGDADARAQSPTTVTSSWRLRAPRRALAALTAPALLALGFVVWSSAREPAPARTATPPGPSVAASLDLSPPPRNEPPTPVSPEPRARSNPAHRSPRTEPRKPIEAPRATPDAANGSPATIARRAAPAPPRVRVVRQRVRHLHSGPAPAVAGSSGYPAWPDHLE